MTTDNADGTTGFPTETEARGRDAIRARTVYTVVVVIVVIIAPGVFKSSARLPYGPAATAAAAGVS